MHSSRMRTARSSSRHWKGGGSGPALPEFPPWMWAWIWSPSISPLDVGLDLIPLNFPLGCGPGPDPPQFPPWVWAWRGVSLAGGSPWWGGGSSLADPPVNRMTEACENITLPQTSFAGGNNQDAILLPTSKGSSLPPLFEWLQQHHAHSHQYVTCRTGKTLVSNTEHVCNLIDTYRLCFFIHRGCVITWYTEKNVPRPVVFTRNYCCFHKRVSFCPQGEVYTPQADTPWADNPPHPPRQTPHPRRPLHRTLHILLECILVGL